VVEKGTKPIVLVGGGGTCLYYTRYGRGTTNVKAASDFLCWMWWASFLMTSVDWEDVEDVQAFAIDGDDWDGESEEKRPYEEHIRAAVE